MMTGRIDAIDLHRMTLMIQPVILCGGAGTRLWPESRGTRAKQFLLLHGQRSLFRQTVERTPAGPISCRRSSSAATAMSRWSANR
jgi:hypothetical protein